MKKICFNFFIFHKSNKNISNNVGYKNNAGMGSKFMIEGLVIGVISDWLLVNGVISDW